MTTMYMESLDIQSMLYCFSFYVIFSFFAISQLAKDGVVDKPQEQGIRKLKEDLMMPVAMADIRYPLNQKDQPHHPDRDRR